MVTRSFASFTCNFVWRRHIFRNYDDFAERVKGSIPFSEVLGTWHHFLSSLDEFPDFQRDVDLGALEKCMIFQKEIESASLSCNWERQRKVKNLASLICKEIHQLKGEEKLYIPGGALEQRKIQRIYVHPQEEVIEKTRQWFMD